MSEKNYEPRMHTAEHILNQTMVQMFGCPRSRNSHIERKKSKCDYILPEAPSAQQIVEIETRVNTIINQKLPISDGMVPRQEASQYLDLSKLPPDAPDLLRVVRVGDYDSCACIGPHVSNTSEIGIFKIISTDFAENSLRIRFKLL